MGEMTEWEKKITDELNLVTDLSRLEKVRVLEIIKREIKEYHEQIKNAVLGGHCISNLNIFKKDRGIE